MMLGLLPLRALLLPQLRQLAFKCHFLVVPEKIFLTLIFLIWKLFSIVYNEIICHAAFNIFLTFVVSREVLREEDFLKCVLQSSINTKINKMSRVAIFYVKIWIKWIVISQIQPTCEVLLIKYFMFIRWWLDHIDCPRWRRSSCDHQQESEIWADSRCVGGARWHWCCDWWRKSWCVPLHHWHHWLDSMQSWTVEIVILIWVE